MVFVLWFLRLQGFGELMAKAKLDLSGRGRRCPRAPFTFLEASSQRSPPFDDRRRRRCGGTLPVHHQVTYKILRAIPPLMVLKMLAA